MFGWSSAGGEPALALEARSEHRIVGETGVDQLERHGTPERQIGGAEHRGHAASSRDRVDAMARERRPYLDLALRAGARPGAASRAGRHGGQARAERGSRYVRPAAAARMASTSSVSAPALST